MSKKYLVLDDTGEVVNSILANDGFKLEGFELVEAPTSEQIEIGDKRVGQGWEKKPEPPAPAPVPFVPSQAAIEQRAMLNKAGLTAQELADARQELIDENA